MLKIFRLIKEFKDYKKKNSIKKLKTNPKLDYKVLIINDDSEDLNTSLGITKERSSEISDICITSYINNTSLSKTLLEVSNEMNHQNELVFATMIVSKMHLKNENPIMQIFKSLNNE